MPASRHLAESLHMRRWRHPHISMSANRGGLLVGPDPTQGMGKGACGVGNDVGVAGIGFGFAGIQICDPSHRQSRQIAHCDPSCAGHSDRQRSD
jgi:hypothetical protein